MEKCDNGFMLSWNDLSADEQALWLLNGLEMCKGSEDWNLFHYDKNMKNKTFDIFKYEELLVFIAAGRRNGKTIKTTEKYIENWLEHKRT